MRGWHRIVSLSVPFVWASASAALLAVSGCAGTRPPANAPASAKPDAAANTTAERVRADGLPLLRLSPAALGGAHYALNQRLSIFRLDRPQEPPQRVEVVLQLDKSELLLAGFALGQRVLLMRWDGSQLSVQRHAALPAEVDTDRMLRDLTLVFWPAEAVQRALPPGWSWVEAQGEWRLLQDGHLRMDVRRVSDSEVVLVNDAEGYRLQVESRAREVP